MPPIQLVNDLQYNNDKGNVSILVSIDAPVEVNPDIDSNNESKNEGI